MTTDDLIRWLHEDAEKIRQKTGQPALGDVCTVAAATIKRLCERLELVMDFASDVVDEHYQRGQCDCDASVGINNCAVCEIRSFNREQREYGAQHLDAKPFEERDVIVPIRQNIKHFPAKIGGKERPHFFVYHNNAQNVSGDVLVEEWWIMQGVTLLERHENERDAQHRCEILNSQVGERSNER